MQIASAFLLLIYTQRFDCKREFGVNIHENCD